MAKFPHLMSVKGLTRLCCSPQAQLESADEPSAGVWAHRAVLAAASPYFLAMFTQFGERTQASVTIQVLACLNA